MIPRHDARAPRPLDKYVRAPLCHVPIWRPWTRLKKVLRLPQEPPVILTGPTELLCLQPVNCAVHVLTQFLTTRLVQCPSGLRPELSSPAQTRGQWVRLSLEVGRPLVCVHSSCVCVEADPLPKVYYRLYIRLRNWKKGEFEGLQIR